MNSVRAICIIVTHNRSALLLDCLAAVSSQSFAPARIVVVDNASEDDTQEVLFAGGWLRRADVDYLRLEQNLGGAGGFAAGVDFAASCSTPAWLWLMDDDAVPHQDALERLLEIADDPRNVYGSLAVSGTETSWPVTIKGRSVRSTNACNVPERAPVSSIPFLGFMIHTDLVKRIGLPDASYFIAADDMEYCRRAEFHGADLTIASRSLIEHPKARFREVDFLGWRWIYFYLPPWKRYYDTRNRLLLGKRHYGANFYFKTIPGSLARILAVLLFESERATQLKGCLCGILDGLLGLAGRRHERWGMGR